MHLPRPKKEDLPELVTESGHAIPVYDLLEIQPDKVTHYLCEQADWQAAIMYSHGKYKLGVEHAKKKVDETEAEVMVDLWKSYTASGTKITADVMKALVTVDIKVKAAKAKLRKLQELEMSFEVMRNAMQTRKDMLIQLGADVRLDKKQAV